MSVTEQIIEVVERGRKLGLTNAELDQMLCAIGCGRVVHQIGWLDRLLLRSGRPRALSDLRTPMRFRIGSAERRARHKRTPRNCRVPSKSDLAAGQFSAAVVHQLRQGVLVQLVQAVQRASHSDHNRARSQDRKSRGGFGSGCLPRLRAIVPSCRDADCRGRAVAL